MGDLNGFYITKIEPQNVEKTTINKKLDSSKLFIFV